MNNEHVAPLHIRSEEHDPNKPFDGDLFHRQDLANRLTGMIERMSHGCVLAIDAPWGEGKTWFGKNCVTHLRSLDFPVVFIDAFKQDYIDDPFLMLCSEVLAEFKADEQAKDKFVEAAVKVAKLLIPIAAKSAVRIAEHFFFSSIDVSEGIQKTVEEMDKGMADAFEKQLAKRLSDHAKDKSSVEGFKGVLKAYATSPGNKPLVVVIDELDRCRPDFAVATVERIKHFFDVPRVVFVLLVNRHQIEAAIRGVYGADVDARAYLSKFVQIWLRLPKTRAQEPLSKNHNHIYCQELARRFGLVQTMGHDSFRDVFSVLASLKGLSLRDLERGYTLYSLAQPLGNKSDFVGWAIYLKLILPEVHAGILAGEAVAHQSARNELDWMIKAAIDLPILSAFDDLHRLVVEKGTPPLSEQTKELLSRELGIRNIGNPDQFLSQFFRKIELDVEN